MDDTNVTSIDAPASHIECPLDATDSAPTAPPAASPSTPLTPPCVTIRQLCAKDVFTILRIISASVGTVDDVKALFAGVSLEGADASSASKILEVGASATFAIVQGLLNNAYDETMVWLSDLALLSREDFEARPPAAVIEVMTQLSEQEGIGDFFSKCSALWSR